MLLTGLVSLHPSLGLCLEVPEDVGGLFLLGETEPGADSQDRGLQLCPWQPPGRVCTPGGPAASPAMHRKPPSLSHSHIAAGLPLHLMSLGIQGLTQQNQTSK